MEPFRAPYVGTWEAGPGFGSSLVDVAPVGFFGQDDLAWSLSLGCKLCLSILCGFFFGFWGSVSFVCLCLGVLLCMLFLFSFYLSTLNISGKPMGHRSLMDFSMGPYCFP